MAKARKTFGKALSIYLCLMLVVSAFLGAIPVFAEETPDASVYGTAADGISKSNGNELNGIYVKPTEITTDFSEGLKYWGASGNKIGTASEYASVEDGVLTVKYHETTPAKYDGVQTVRINIPKEAEGKKIGFVCDVQRTALLGLMLSTNTGERASYSYGNANTTQTFTDWYTVTGNVLPKDTANSMFMTMQFSDTTPENNIGQEFKVRNLRIGYINDEGIFTQLNGELWNTKYNTPYYGTNEDGIFTTDHKGAAGQNLAPFETLVNENFSDGLKYWSSFGTNGNLYASDMASIEDGQLVFTAAADANSSLSVMSSGVKIPDGLTGKMLGVAFYVDSPNNQFSVGYRTNNAEGLAVGSKDGSTFSARPSCRVRADGTGRGYQLTENDKVVYIYFKQYNNSAAMHGGVTRIDDVVLFWYDPSDTTVGYTFDGQRVTLAQGYGNVNYYSYGTEEKGIYINGNNENQDEIPALDDFNNIDYSQGLKYWGGPADKSGYASKYASVEDGILTLTSDGDAYAATVSAPIKVKSDWIGKKMHIFLKVRTDSTDTGYSINMYTNTYGNWFSWWSAGGDVKGNEGFVFKHLTSNEAFEASDNNFLIEHKVGVKTDGAYAQVTDVKLAFENADGTFTTIDGELLNQYGHEMYGTEKDGIYSGTGNGVMGQTTPYLENAMNFNFSEGLKYWSCFGIKETYASDVASVENGELVFTATTEEGKTSYYNVMSAGVRIPENMVGKKIGVLFYMNSPGAQVSATVHTNTNTTGTGYTFSARNARTGLTGNNTHTVTAEDEVVYVSLKQAGTNGAVTKIDDVILYYFDPATPDECYSLDGQPITMNNAFYYTYGTEEKGIYVYGQGAAQTPVRNIVALDELTNFDFSQGLKYWGTASKAQAYASDVALVENGKLKLSDSADEAYCGIRSVSVKLPKAAKGKNVVVSYDLNSNCMFAIKMHTNNANSDWFSRNTTGEKSLRVTTTAYAVSAEAETLAIEMQIYGDRNNPTHYALVDNITIQIVDEGGMEGKYAELNGAPIGYEYGDVNADGTVDLIDVVRLKKHFANISGTEIYLAAANADKDEEMSITTGDLISLTKILLGVE